MTPNPIVWVAVDMPAHSALGGVLAYEAATALAPGTLVRVPLGRRVVTGVVWPAPSGEAADAPPPEQIKPIQSVLPGLNPLGPAWLQLVQFAAFYYQRSVGEVALAHLPAPVRDADEALLQKRLRRWAKKVGVAASAVEPPVPPTLMPEQALALDALAQAGHDKPVLLFGVTGSGKTEVYLRAAQAALAAGRQVLVLVPEINLTPQLEARFSARFPQHRLAVLHSGMAPVQRFEHWLAAHEGQADLVLGTRLGVFASMPRLGLIVVDEEHDPSFKQQDGARYSARDLAVYRGKLQGCQVLLGSATPALETWAHAETGRYLRLTLAQRVGAGSLPRLRVLDMSQLPKVAGAPPVLAPRLLQAIEERIARGEQSLLFLNRRGYSPVLHCPACSWKSGCPHCSAFRVFHKVDRSLRCHHCGFAERVPRACPDCGNLDIAPVGRGTEKLEEQLQELLPSARVARIDADTTRLKGSLETQLAAVHAGEVDVLVGTQMVAKGHDFRRITLVAAVNPDSALFAADFRAPERLFSLLMQAAGRAGRDAAQAERSEVWLQTWNPQHALYAALAAHDFSAFAAGQLREREQAGLPPYASLALLRGEARTTEAAQAFLQAARAAGQTLAAHHGLAVTLYPPVPLSVARVANVERMQMLSESASRAQLQRFMHLWTPHLHALRAQHKAVVRWALDVDPLSI